MVWPFFDLRITSGEVTMRGLSDADLPALLDALPDDLEMNPANETFARLAPEADRRRQLVAEIWKHRGTWSPDAWCLDLAVEVEGRVVGVQALEGEQFPLLRTVDSFSWLATDVRGRGLADGGERLLVARGDRFVRLRGLEPLPPDEVAVAVGDLDDVSRLGGARIRPVAGDLDLTLGLVQLSHAGSRRVRSGQAPGAACVDPRPTPHPHGRGRA